MTTSPAGAVGLLAPPAVVAQLPPTPPPNTQVDTVPSSFGVNTTQGADDSGGGSPSNNTPGNVGGATEPVDDPVPFTCAEASDRLSTLTNSLLPAAQKALEDVKAKKATREQIGAASGALFKIKQEIATLTDFLDEEC